MSAVFLYVSGGDVAQAARCAAEQLPFVPESSHAIALPDGAALHVWSVVDEVSGGGWWSGDAQRGWVVWDGWAEGAPATGAAAWLAGRLAALGAHGLIHEQAGQLSMARVEPSGEVVALTDFLGARHLYYGQRGARVVVSNRAMVASAALEGGAPVLEPLHLSWFMASIACLFAGQTVWRDVRALGEREVLRVRGGRLEVEGARALEPQALEWDAHWEALRARVRGLVGRGGLPTRIAVTGGKDSRVILAAVVGEGLQERVTGYLRIGAGHQDELVARRLCARYGIAFEREPLPDPDAEPVEVLLDRHNFQAEHQLHAWDYKGAAVHRREVGLHGHFGEIYRSHALPRFVLGWPEVRRKYLSTKYLDLYDVMTPEALAHVRAGTREWVEARQAEGIRPLALHDRMHRAARMHRWAGHCLQIDGSVTMMASPLCSPALLRHYLGMSLLEQRRHRVHFELVRRADDWLWRQPFAESSWALGVAPLWPPRAAPVPAQGVEGRQLALWRAQGDALAALVTAPGSHAYDALFDRARIQRLVETTRQRPSAHNVRAILGLAGVRRTIDADRAEVAGLRIAR
jgi:hypothetical protein